VITALDYIGPGAEFSWAGRKLLWLQLGAFDVWSDAAQAAISGEARLVGLLQAGQALDERVWSLLAATGGRPREISTSLARLKGTKLTDPRGSSLMKALFTSEVSEVLQKYLLPSMLGVLFDPFVGRKSLTQFGSDATDLGLLNADEVVLSGVRAPTVALAYIESSVDDVLCDVMKALVEATAFCSLEGSGKDFEHAWVLLVFSHLLLQHNVRVGGDVQNFWPRATDGRQLGGPERPTATAIEVFQKAGVFRGDALFLMPYPTRVHKAPLIACKIMFAPVVPPTLAIWDDLWVPNVCAGVSPSAWSMATCDVEWRASTVVYFSKVTRTAIDFMLLVGNANGTGDAQPHVYMFQCKTLEGSASTTSVTVHGVVANIQKHLKRLFSKRFAGHVLRRAGITSVAQVTVCVNALMFGSLVDASTLTVPFGVVLFDESDFRALGGAAFENTKFFRDLSKLQKLRTEATHAHKRRRRSGSEVIWT